MMKKIALVILLAICVLAPANAKDMAERDKAVSMNELPMKAQTFIKSYFGDKKISYAKMEKEWFEKSYTVHFTDGTKIEFTGNGEVEEMGGRRIALPKGAVPQGIVKYTDEFYPNAQIWNVNHDDKAWMVRLSSGVKIKFDESFKVLDIKQGKMNRPGKMGKGEKHGKKFQGKMTGKKCEAGKHRK